MCIYLIHICMHIFDAAKKTLSLYCKILWNDHRTLEVSTPNSILQTII